MKAQLRRLNLTKRQLAEDLGYSSEQVSRWGDAPPKHVLAYLDLLEAYLLNNSEAEKSAAKIETILRILKEA